VRDRKFGLSLDSVREAIGMQPITPVPCSLPYLFGLVSLRDLVVPLIDLATKLSIPAGEAGVPEQELQGIVICASENENEFFGVVVDDIDSVIALDSNDIKSPPKLSMDQRESTYIRGITRIDGELILLLNPNLVVTSSDLSVLGDLQKAA
jgi:purine-binding chemotaxis protein CheW